jgi:hypothetical protein
MEARLDSFREQAWALVQAGAATLVDVRSAEERKFVGHVPEAAHVAWASGKVRDTLRDNWAAGLCVAPGSLDRRGARTNKNLDDSRPQGQRRLSAAIVNRSAAGRKAPT